MLRSIPAHVREPLIGRYYPLAHIARAIITGCSALVVLHQVHPISVHYLLGRLSQA